MNIPFYSSINLQFLLNYIEEELQDNLLRKQRNSHLDGMVEKNAVHGLPNHLPSHGMRKTSLTDLHSLYRMAMFSARENGKFEINTIVVKVNMP